MDFLPSPATGLSPPEPVLTSDLFPEVLDHLLKLLNELDEEGWNAPTICSGWSVKDVALHLLGVEIGNLSARRDRYFLGANSEDWEKVVASINRWNWEWVVVARRISAPLLIELLGFAGEKANLYFRSLDPFAMGGPVIWAGPEPQPVWLDIAREYTERWHHQQHIREAVGKPGLKGAKHLQPVLATFVWALPQAFLRRTAPEGTSVTLSITGDSGGKWSVLREQDGWRFYQGASPDPSAAITLDEDLAWRLFTKGVTRDVARNRITLAGDQSLAESIFEMVAIIA